MAGSQYTDDPVAEALAQYRAGRTKAPQPKYKKVEEVQSRGIGADPVLPTEDTAAEDARKAEDERPMSFGEMYDMLAKWQSEQLDMEDSYGRKKFEADNLLKDPVNNADKILQSDAGLRAQRKWLDSRREQLDAGFKRYQEQKDAYDSAILRGDLSGPSDLVGGIAHFLGSIPGGGGLLRAVAYPMRAVGGVAGAVGDIVGAGVDFVTGDESSMKMRADKYQRIADASGGNPFVATEKLGEETARDVGRLWAEANKAVPFSPLHAAGVGISALGRELKGAKSEELNILGGYLPDSAYNFDKFTGQLGFEFATDPLLLVGKTGKVAQLGEKLGPGIATVTDVAARGRVLRELPELRAALKGVSREELSAVARGERDLAHLLLRDPAMTPEAAGALEKSFEDAALRARTDLVSRPTLKAQTEGIRAGIEGLDVPKEALAKFDEAARYAEDKGIESLFYSKIDPKTGEAIPLTFREQQEVGLRTGVMGEVYARAGELLRPVGDLGDKIPGVKWAKDTIRKAIISDVPDDAEWLSFEYSRKLAATRDTIEAYASGREAAEKFAEKLNASTFDPADRAHVSSLAQQVHERVPQELRTPGTLQIPGYAPSEVQSIIDLADMIGAQESDLLRWQQAKGLPIQALQDDVLTGFIGHRFSPETMKWMAENPEARKRMLSRTAEFSRGAGLDIHAPQFEARKIKGMSLAEKDAFLRARWEPEGFPKGQDIFDKNYARVIEGDYHSAARALERQHAMDSLGRVFGTAPDDELLVAAADILSGEVSDRKLQRFAAALKARTLADEAAVTGQKFHEGAKALRAEGRAAAREPGQKAAALTKEMEREQRRLLSKGDAYAEATGKMQDVRAEAPKATDAGRLDSPRIQEIQRGMGDAAREMESVLKTMDISGGPVGKDVAAKARKAWRDFERKINTMEREQIRRLGPGPEGITEYDPLRELMPKYRAAFDQLSKDLKGAASKAAISEYRGLGRDAEREAAKRFEAYKASYQKLLDEANAHIGRLETAQGAIGKDVGAAVRRTVRERAKTAAELEDLAKSYAPLEGESRAAFTRRVLEKNGLYAPDGTISMLDVYEKMGARIPSKPGDLAKLALTFVSEDDWRIFGDIAGGLKDILKAEVKPGGTLRKVLDGYDAIVRWQKKSLLARGVSALKDLKGNAMWLTVAAGPGVIQDLDEARKALGGFNDWMLGNVKATGEMERAKALGVLETMSGVELERPAAANIPFGAVGRSLERRGYIGAAVEGLGSLAGRTGHMPTLAKAGELGADIATQTTDVALQFRKYQDQVTRYAMWRNAIRRGFSEQAAALETFKWFGNFNDMTKFEKTVLQRVFLFYSWQKKMLPAALRAFLEKPFQARMLLALTVGNVQGEDVDQWLKRSGGWMLGRGKNGQADVINLGAGSPMSVVQDFTQSEIIHEMQAGLKSGSFAKAAVGALHGGAATLARKGSPFVTGAYELASGQESLTGYDVTGRGLGKQANKLPAALGWLKDVPGMTYFLGIDAEMSGPDEVAYYKVDAEKRLVLDILAPGINATLNDISRTYDPRASIPRAVTRGFIGNVAGSPVYNVETGERRGQITKLSEMEKELNDQALEVSGSPFVVDEQTNALRINKRSSRFWDLFPAGFSGAMSERRNQLSHLKELADGGDGYAREVYRILLLSTSIKRVKDALRNGEDPSTVSIKDLGLDDIFAGDVEYHKRNLRGVPR